MVPSKALIKDLRTVYAALCSKAIDVHDYEGPMFDTAFDIITIETGIAGIADTTLASGRVPKEHLEVLRRPILSENTKLVRLDGTIIDLSEIRELLGHVQLIERIRQICLQLAEE